MTEKFKVGDKVKVQPGHPDIGGAYGESGGWGWWYDDFLSGVIGKVIEVDDYGGVKIQMERVVNGVVEHDFFRECSKHLLKYIAVVNVNDKATMEDAEKLIALTQQLKISEAEFNYAKDLVATTEAEIVKLSFEISALKQKLNIA